MPDTTPENTIASSITDLATVPLGELAGDAAPAAGAVLERVLDGDGGAGITVYSFNASI